MKQYPSPGITVIWNPELCIHTGNCLRGSPAVFDRGRQPWIDVTAGNPEDIAHTIRTCPTGALTYLPGEGMEPESVESPTRVEVRPNGPLFLRGDIQVTNTSGDMLAELPRVALCRCGGSANKPFCDGSHRSNGFKG